MTSAYQANCIMSIAVLHLKAECMLPDYRYSAQMQCVQILHHCRYGKGSTSKSVKYANP